MCFIINLNLSYLILLYSSNFKHFEDTTFLKYKKYCNYNNFFYLHLLIYLDYKYNLNEVMKKKQTNQTYFNILLNMTKLFL